MPASRLSLPSIPPPSLHDLQAEVEAPVPPTAEELIEALHQALRATSPRRKRAAGEPIQPGDEVECDLIALAGGRLVPGGLHRRALLEMRAFQHLPGLLELFLGLTPGQARTGELTLPPDYPVPEFASSQVTVFLQVHQVAEVAPRALDDADALRQAGLGDTVEEAMQSLSERLDQEQGEELLILATQAVLASLADRVEIDLDPQLIDEELQRVWNHSSGELLQQLDLPADLIELAQNDFVSQPDLRWQAEQRLKIGLALAALVAEHGLTPEPEIMEELLLAASQQLRLTPQQAREALRQEPEQAQLSASTALYLRAVEYVMSHAQVTVIEPEQEPAPVSRD